MRTHYIGKIPNTTNTGEMSSTGKQKDPAIQVYSTHTELKPKEIAPMPMV